MGVILKLLVFCVTLWLIISGLKFWEMCDWFAGLGERLDLGVGELFNLLYAKIFTKFVHQLHIFDHE